jgi:hypothetical protein
LSSIVDIFFRSVDFSYDLSLTNGNLLQCVHIKSAFVCTKVNLKFANWRLKLGLINCFLKKNNDVSTGQMTSDVICYQLPFPSLCKNKSSLNGKNGKLKEERNHIGIGEVKQGNFKQKLSPSPESVVKGVRKSTCMLYGLRRVLSTCSSVKEGLLLKKTRE